MLDQIRKFVNERPWLGWLVAGVVLVGSYFVYRYMSGANDPYTVERLSETVTIRCSESGDEWQMNRGEMELELRQRMGMIKPGDGLRNPKTGKLTGFPKSDWDSTIERLNAERQEAIDRRKKGGAPAATSKTAPGNK